MNINKKEIIIFAIVSIIIVIFFKTYCKPSGLACFNPQPSWLMAIAQFLCFALAYFSGRKLRNLKKNEGGKINFFYFYIYIFLMLVGSVTLVYLWLNKYIF